MGRKRNDPENEKTKLTIWIEKSLKAELKDNGINMTQLFRDAAFKILQNKK